MNICSNPSPRTVNSNTAPEGNRISFKGSKKQLKVLDSDDPQPVKLQALNPVVTYLERKINNRSVTGVAPFFYSETNQPKTMNPWCIEFECIYRSLAKENHLKVEAQVNALSDVHIKSVPIITPPGEFLSKLQIPGSLFELASVSREAGKIFFQALFDRLTPEQLRVALSESIDGKPTLLYYACRLIDKPLVKQLENKLGRQTLLEMVTRPINHQAPPLACACLYSGSTYLFDTVLWHDRELAVKLVKGGPDIDQTLLQFMCDDAQSHLISFMISIEVHRERIKQLLYTLNKQDRFDAVRFTGKADESALLSVCTKSRDPDLATILTATLDDDQITELCTARAKTGNSLVQKCLESDQINGVIELCMSIRDPLLRYKVLSIRTPAGHSLFQQWCHCPVINRIKDMLHGMGDNHRASLIVGDRRIWDQITESPDPKNMTMSFSDLRQSLCGLRDRKYTIAFGHQFTLRQQRQTPIIYAMSMKNIRLAKFLLEQIADSELKTRLLLHKTENGTSLLQHMFDDGYQWHYLKTRLQNASNPIERDLLVIELYLRAMAAGLFTDADNYSKQLRDPQIKHHLFEKNHKYLLLNLCQNGKTITEAFFSRLTRSQCTKSVVYALEQTLYNNEKHLLKHIEDPLMESLPQLLTLQKNVGHKDNFVTWATSEQQGKQCPLVTTMKRFVVAYCEKNHPQYFSLGFGNESFIEMEASLNLQLFQGIMSMMNEEQIKVFFLSLQEKSANTLHLLGYKDILATTVDTLDDSGRAFLEQINPANGGNLLHILFENRFIDFSDIRLTDLIETVEWLDETYGLTRFLQGRLEDDGSTPLHVFLSTVKKKSKLTGYISPEVQEHILTQLCQPTADGMVLVELLKLKDNNGCTPLHKFFSCKQTNEEIGKLLINALGLDTFYQLLNIKDKQDTTAMDHCSKNHVHLYEEYERLFQKSPLRQ